MKLKVICPICSKYFWSISASHLLRKHNLNMQNFRKKYPNYKLVSETKKKKVSLSCKKSGCGKWFKDIKFSKERKNKVSIATSGTNNPFYGRKHTIKTKLKMRKNHANFIGNKNPLVKYLKICSKEQKQKYCNSIKEGKEIFKKDKTKFKLFKERLSKSIIQAHINGKCKSYGRGHKIGYFYSEKMNKKIFYRSSYEFRFLQWCELNKKIKIFDSCNFSIQYEVNKNVKNYLPDFIINNKIIVEIKPKSMLKFNVTKAKAALLFCKNNNLYYTVLTESELSNLDKIEELKFL